MICRQALAKIIDVDALDSELAEQAQLIGGIRDHSAVSYPSLASIAVAKRAWRTLARSEMNDIAYGLTLLNELIIDIISRYRIKPAEHDRLAVSRRAAVVAPAASLDINRRATPDESFIAKSRHASNIRPSALARQACASLSRGYRASANALESGVNRAANSTGCGGPVAKLSDW